MPQILEIKEIDDELWVRVGKPGDFESGIALWTPQEQEANEKAATLAERERILKVIEGCVEEVAREIREAQMSFMREEFPKIRHVGLNYIEEEIVPERQSQAALAVLTRKIQEEV